MEETRKQPWRQACEAVLRARTTHDALRFWGFGHGAEGALEPVFDYRFEHTLAVVKLARWLSPLAGADSEVVECAAWLHDVAKRLNDPEGKDHHAQEAAALLPELLDSTDFPTRKIDAVRHAILHHVGLRLTKRLDPLETACLWDADKLSKLGAASLVHFMGISGGFGPTDTTSILAKGERWLGLAEGIAESMNTEPAQKEAWHRLAFLRRHYEQLAREWAEPMRPSPLEPGIGEARR